MPKINTYSTDRIYVTVVVTHLYTAAKCASRAGRSFSRCSVVIPVCSARRVVAETHNCHGDHLLHDTVFIEWFSENNRIRFFPKVNVRYTGPKLAASPSKKDQAFCWPGWQRPIQDTNDEHNGNEWFGTVDRIIII